VSLIGVLLSVTICLPGVVARYEGVVDTFEQWTGGRRVWFHALEENGSEEGWEWRCQSRQEAFS